MHFRFTYILSLILLFCISLHAADKQKPYNVLFIISDDLTTTALGCYGNTVCQTPNIDKLATEGTLFNRAYCQATFCGPSRASFMFGYYPYASKASGYTSGRKEVIELLRQRSRPYLFSNTLAPAVVAASLKALELLGSSTELKNRLLENTRYFRETMVAPRSRPRLCGG